MAQRKQLSWTELRVGLFVLAGLAILAVAVFYVTGSNFLGPKYRILSYQAEVEGLEIGAPVRLDGVAIGNVQSIDLTPHPQDPAHNITLVLRIQKKFQNEIRTDSSAGLVTEGLLGNRYVTISRGLTGQVIQPNGVIESRGNTGMAALVERSGALMTNLTDLSKQLNGVVADIHAGRGSVGMLISDPSLYNHLNATATKLDAVATSIQKGQGTLGKLANSDEIYNKASEAVDHINNVLAAVQSQQGTLGKIVYDPAMYDSAKSLMDKGNTLFNGINEGQGTLGKLAHDEALYNNLRDASGNFRDATAKLNSNQGTLGKLFVDPALYDNMTGLSGDMRLFINDFRANPGKFLHIKLGLF
jgi:phospholipid/cholesterol/gamma-HCH transport system substrate-binding protein